MQGPGIVVFASGRGSNFQALCHAIERGDLRAHVVALVTNVQGCGAVAIAKKHGIPVLEVPHSGKKRSEHEQAIHEALKPFRFDWVVLAGYMRIFSKEFIDSFFDKHLGTSRMVNVHPSLLPAFPGVGAYAQAFAYGAHIAGATVHLVEAQVDSGPILSQASFEILPDDSVESVEKKGLALEHQLFPKTLQKLFHHRFHLEKMEGSSRFRVRFEK